MSEPLRVAIIDDEPLARRALQTLVATVPWLVVAGEARTGESAIALLKSTPFDLVFMDVRLPGPSGIDVLRAVKPAAAVIFTTAFDEYALTAFELGAIDYLRKPFGRVRFAAAIERARIQLNGARVPSPDEETVTLEERLAHAESGERPMTRLFVRDRGAIVPVRLTEVSRFESDGDYVAIHARGRRWLIYLNLSDLADALDASRFVRVHRSHIVNLDYVDTVIPRDPTRVEVRMRDGARVPASRTGTAALRARMRIEAPD